MSREQLALELGVGAVDLRRREEAEAPLIVPVEAPTAALLRHAAVPTATGLSSPIRQRVAAPRLAP